MTVWDYIEKKNGKIVRTENYGSMTKLWKAENIVIEGVVDGTEKDSQKFRKFLNSQGKKFETKDFLIIKKEMI